MSKAFNIYKLSTNVRVISTCFTLALPLFNSNIQAMSSDSEVDDSESHQFSCLKNKRKVAKIAAKAAAESAAEKTALRIINDEEEAQEFAKSLISGKKLNHKNDQKPCEVRLKGLMANMIIQQSKEAATKAAFDILHDENEAMKIVNSLKLYRYSKNSNPEGKKGKDSPLSVESLDKRSNIITLGNVNDANSIEEDERREVTHLQVKLLRKQAKTQGVDSPQLTHKNVAETIETAEEVADKAIPIVGSIAKHILHFIH